MRLPAIDLAPDHVVDRRARRQDGAGAQNRALADNRTLVDSAVSAHQNVVFLHDRHIAHRFENPADLGAGRDVNALSHLGAGADQRV